MKITFLFYSFQFGGAECSALNLCLALNALGADTVILVGKREGQLLQQIPANIEVQNLGHNKILWPLNLAKHLRRDKPELLISDSTILNVFAVFSKFLLGSRTKLRLTEHLIMSIDRRIGWNRQWLLLPLIYIAYRIAMFIYHDQVGAVSQFAAVDLEKRLRLPKNSVTLVANSIISADHARQSSAPVSHPWFNDSTPIFIAVGRLSPEKGFNRLIESFAQVRKKFSCRLLIIGEGHERSSLQKLINSLALKTSIDLHGFAKFPIALMSRSFCLLHSSVHESFGNVLVEALSVGCPVIAMDCPGGVSEILGNGKYGKLVRNQDFRAFEEAMLAALQNKLRVSRAPFSAEQYSALANAKKILAEYAELK